MVLFCCSALLHWGTLLLSLFEHRRSFSCFWTVFFEDDLYLQDLNVENCHSICYILATHGYWKTVSIWRVDFDHVVTSVFQKPCKLCCIRIVNIFSLRQSWKKGEQEAWKKHIWKLNKAPRCQADINQFTKVMIKKEQRVNDACTSLKHFRCRFQSFNLIWLKEQLFSLKKSKTTDFLPKPAWINCNV